MSRPRSILPVLALALLTTGFVACGDDEGGDTTVNNTTTVVAGGGDDTTTTTTTTTTSTEDDTTDDGADGSDDDAEPVLSLERFRSPSGNIACLMSAKSVRCDIAEKAWEAPRPPSCPDFSDYGQGLALNAKGQAMVVCAGDTVRDPKAPVLEYDTTSRIGPITCESDDSGIECSNSRGGEFKLSREEYELD